MTDADKILNEMSKVRLREQQHQKYDAEHLAKCEYVDYYMWCKINDYECNDKNFKKYIQKTNKDVSFWIKKKMFEMYFNYVFEFDTNNSSWKSYKKAI